MPLGTNLDPQNHPILERLDMSNSKTLFYQFLWLCSEGIGFTVKTFSGCHAEHLPVGTGRHGWWCGLCLRFKIQKKRILTVLGYVDIKSVVTPDEKLFIARSIVSQFGQKRDGSSCVISPAGHNRPRTLVGVDCHIGILNCAWKKVDDEVDGVFVDFVRR